MPRLLLYCTKQPHKLYATDKGYVITDFELGDYYKTKEKLNGKIVAECDYEVEKITTFKDYTGYEEYDIHYQTAKRDYERLLQETCLNNQQLDDYLQGENGYAIHIKNLHIFDDSRELSEYDKYEYEVFSSNGGCIGTEWKPIDKAPQNMMYCYDDGEKCILISIRPEWLCKILNKEKTIEIRKKVLKEMLK